MSDLSNTQVSSSAQNNVQQTGTSTTGTSGVSNVPATQQENFVASFHEGEMNLEPLKDKLFAVSINKGDRDKPQYLCTQLRGPFDFFDMVEYVGNMYANNIMHCKVMTLVKGAKDQPQFLDSGTVDYIETFYKDIIMDGILSGEGPFADIEKSLEPGFISDLNEEGFKP